MPYRLRTLLIVLALGPMVLAWAVAWWASWDRPQSIAESFAREGYLGKRKDEVEAMLGPPYSTQNGQSLYWFGSDGEGHDEWLEIAFSDGRATTVRFRD